MTVNNGSPRTTGTFVRSGHSDPSRTGHVFRDIAQSVDDEDDEAAEIQAMISRNLRTRLMGAGLLKPNRTVTPESAALEAEIRQEAQGRLDNALASLARKRELAAVIRPEDDFIVSQAVEWIEQLGEDASNPEAPLQIANDWSIVARATGTKGQQLGDIGKNIITEYFVGYLARGEAPSIELQKNFDNFREKFSNIEDISVPSQELIGVFDRLLATDIDIERKRAHNAADAFIKDFNDHVATDLPRIEDRARRKPLARFVFLNLAWVFAVLAGVWVAGEDLSDMYPDDQNRVLFICALPMIVWGGWRLYRKLG